MKRYDDPLDIMLDFQSWRGKAPEPPDTDDGEADPNAQRGWPHYAAPSRSAIRKLKGKHPDYRPGKVKVYTAEEIEEYERARS